jgi:hypothetical protein
MATAPLALSNLVDITVTVAPNAPAVPSFNQGLFVGPSAVIPSYGADSRLRQYGVGGPAALAGMLTDGFTTSDPEYIAAQLYFSQTPSPNYIWIGVQDATAIATITINAAGTLWAVGDEFDIVAAGGTYGVGKIVSESGGVPSAIAIVTQGTGYSVESATTTAVSPSTGTGLTVHITAVGETLLQASTACRAASTTWYGLVVNNPGLSDNLALSEWADPLWQTTRYYPFSVNVNIPNAVANNLALQLQTLKLRVLGTYATTQSGLYPNNIYAAAAVMGVEMGLNTGLAGSFFNTSYKVLAGVAPEPLTQTQYTNIINAGFNVYANFGAYQFYQPGVMSNGAPSFLWLFIAVLVANIQLNELAVLADNPVVTQTNVDEQLLIGAANDACALLATIGFLAGGTWEGQAFSIIGVSIAVGQALPLGYSVQAQPYSQQSTEARDAGQAMPLYIFVTTAGAVQSLLIGVYVTL